MIVIVKTIIAKILLGGIDDIDALVGTHPDITFIIAAERGNIITANAIGLSGLMNKMGEGFGFGVVPIHASSIGPDKPLLRLPLSPLQRFPQPPATKTR